MNNLEKLKKMECKQNSGRGVSCIRSVIFFMEKDDLESAEAVCFNENDKISNYPEIQSLLKSFFPEYKNFLDRFSI